MEREKFKISEDEMGDFTSEVDKVIHGDQYKFIDVYRTNGDGEWWVVVMQRTKDGKYFEYSWGYEHRGGNYFYEPEWEQVIPKTVTKTTYGWGKGFTDIK